MSERSILFVDDETGVLRSLQRLLRREPVKVYTAEDGHQAMHLLADSKIHVVVADQRMTGMSGTEFLKRVRLSHPDTVRCILSGYAETHAILEAINEGNVYRFIAKPWDDEELVQVLGECLDEYEMRAQNSLLSMSKYVIESLPVAIAAIDQNNHIIYTNRLFAESFDSIPGSLPGQPAGETWRAAARSHAATELPMRTVDMDIRGNSYTANVSHTDIGGSAYTLIAISDVIPDERGSP